MRIDWLVTDSLRHKPWERCSIRHYGLVLAGGLEGFEPLTLQDASALEVYCVDMP